jgi:hypothetical protein
MRAGVDLLGDRRQQPPTLRAPAMIVPAVNDVRPTFRRVDRVWPDTGPTGIV